MTRLLIIKRTLDRFGADADATNVSSFLILLAAGVVGAFSAAALAGLPASDCDLALADKSFSIDDDDSTDSSTSLPRDRKLESFA